MSKKNKGEDELKSFLTREILKAFNNHPNKTFNYKQMERAIRPSIQQYAADKPLSEEINTNGFFRTEILFILADLADKGDVLEVETGKFKLKPSHAYMEGVIDITSSGAAYILSETNEDDIYIAPRNVKNALHGDRVKIFLYARHKNRRLEGEVVEVIRREKTEFAGTVQLAGKYAFVVPDSNKMLVDIFVPQHQLLNARHGQKVIAQIVDWPKGTKNPIGKITRLLGWPGENDVEMNSILSEYGFPLDFPRRVEDESDAIPEGIPGEEAKKRKDFRAIPTFTIDPEDAKDFDDALSVRQLENGHWEIGVHIADVSHYVRPGTQLDREAYNRATSVYLVDRVIPMLPEKLSNGVCSLRPQEDKLCFSAVFEMDDAGKIHKRWIGRTIIHSNYRFTYEQAQEIIESEQGPMVNEIIRLNTFAKSLRSERFKNGAIAFEKVEVRFRLDEKGKPLGVYLKESKDSNKLIEEFMLLANKVVAEYAGRTHKVVASGKKKEKEEEERVRVEKRAFVYRVHDAPVGDRLESFSAFASKWGYKIKTGTDREVAKSLNHLMKELHGKKEQNVLEQLAVRTMSKAIYTTENVGHYGLAFDHYTHFTSPIRRYPDILVHRLLDFYLAGNSGVDPDLLEEQCKHSTQMEIKASEAERASIKYKQVEFLQEKVGEVFEGLISGVTEWGLYVEIVENKCEGMIRLRDLEDDFYEFDDANYCVIGTRTKRKYTLGDAVKVQVVRADLLRKQIDLRIVNGDKQPVRPSGNNQRKHKSKGGKKGAGKGKQVRRKK